jgi:dUTP pyrophosphatase
MQKTLEYFTGELRLKSSHKLFMCLSIFVDSESNELKQIYVDSAKKHNERIMDDPHFYDAGFDIFLPSTQLFGETVNKVDFKVKCCAKVFNCKNMTNYFTPFYTYARSSISKTPLRLANNQGIIDAGYRGNLIGMFDLITSEEYSVQEYSRMLQICAPNLMPIYVNIVDTFEDLGPSTSRGDGGFGSTGK